MYMFITFKVASWRVSAPHQEKRIVTFSSEAVFAAFSLPGADSAAAPEVPESAACVPEGAFVSPPPLEEQADRPAAMVATIKSAVAFFIFFLI